jgi:hypothetical protein
LSEQNDSAADPLDEIKARWANKPEALEVSKAWALVDVRRLIGEVERLRGDLTELLERFKGERASNLRRAGEVLRLRAEVADLKAALATASPGAYFSRYGERPDLPEGSQP